LGILEDDVIFCDDWDERLEYIENNFNLDWDIFYFTSFFHLNHDPKRWKNVEFEFTDIKYITKVYSSFCTHAYLINPKSIPKILDLCQRYQNEAFAIDHLYLLIQPELNCYSFTPGMATQRPGNNDIDLIYKDQSVFKQIVGDHYYCNKLSDFDYEIFYKKNI
jgi:GR25 family glycosyltransferase involved in LPS biosynthesis